MLLIESAPEDRDSIREVVDKHFGRAVVRTSQRVSEALADGLDDIDLLIADTDLPDVKGVAVLEEVFLIRPDMPILLTAKQTDPELASSAIRNGAYDFLVKSPGFFDILPLAIEKNLALHRVKQENARLQVQLTSTLAQLRAKNGQLHNLVKELETIASTDSLTGLANRRAFKTALDHRYAYAVRNDSELALITIDLDGFKHLNDNAGHPAGDQVLALVGRVLTANCRASDVPGRVGGDEFVVLLPESDQNEAMQVAKRIQKDFNQASQQLCSTLGYDGELSMSLGLVTRRSLASFSADALSAESFFNYADKALYRAKAAGKARLEVHGRADM